MYLESFSDDHFPCGQFRSMMQALCRDTDNVLSLSESQSLKTIDWADVDPYEVTSLVGLEYFPYLERLMTGEEWHVDFANLSMNKELTYLDLGGNPKVTSAMIKKYGSKFSDDDKSYTHFKPSSGRLVKD